MASSVPPSRSKRSLKPRPCVLGPRTASRQIHLVQCLNDLMPTDAGMTGSQVADAEIRAESMPCHNQSHGLVG